MVTVPPVQIPVYCYFNDNVAAYLHIVLPPRFQIILVANKQNITCNTSLFHHDIWGWHRNLFYGIFVYDSLATLTREAQIKLPLHPKKKIPIVRKVPDLPSEDVLLHIHWARRSEI